MTVREIPGALVLGLLASLVAHSALYGGGHAMGGAYHDILIQLACTGCVGLLVVFGTLAWAGCRGIADGSVLAARCAARLPGTLPSAAAAALWFVLGECAEPRHADASLGLTAVVVVLAAWAILAVARSGVRLLAAAVLAIARVPFAPRTLPTVRVFTPAPVPRCSPLLRRRFARPPPIASARA